MVKPIRILIVEDHPIYREGMKMALSFSELKCVVVAALTKVKESIEYIESHPGEIDLVMLDYFLPDGSGLDVIKVIRERCPEAKVLVVTSAVDAPEVVSLWGEGINGIISKDVQADEVSGIVDSIMKGDRGMGRNVSNRESVASDDDVCLTQREMEILKLCIRGRSAKQIALELFISPRTVDAHKRNIYSKLGISSSSDLLKVAFQKGLI